MSRAAESAGSGRVAGVLAGLASAERVISLAAFVLLIAVVFIDVLYRELTGTGLHWARQAGVYANLVVVLFGFGLASAGGTHLRPRFADHWLPATWTPAVIRLQEALMSGFCLGLGLVGITVVAETIALDERSPVLGNPIWPFQALIPLVLLVAALRHALYAAQPSLRPPDASAYAAGSAAASRAASGK